MIDRTSTVTVAVIGRDINGDVTVILCREMMVMEVTRSYQCNTAQ